jgi:hypothetical protein
MMKIKQQDLAILPTLETRTEQFGTDKLKLAVLLIRQEKIQDTEFCLLNRTMLTWELKKL